MTVNAPEKKKVERQQTLERITLNNAEECRLRRSSEAEPLIKKIRDVLARGCNVLSDDGEITIGVVPADGSAAFTLGAGKLPVLTCQACWSADVSNTCWEAADSRFQMLAGINRALDFGYQYREAPNAPWFATIVWPQFARIAEKYHREIGMLEPCVVWALWDNEQESVL
jgi:hypothetical protein